MTWKKYQPGRTDFLINTDWGTSSEQLSGETAKSRGMKLFHGRWVNKEEKKQLKEEHATYQSIRIVGGILIVLTFTLLIFINNGEIFKGGIISTSLSVIYGAAMLAAGIGLMRFRRFARNIAVFVFASFLVLPFTPLLENEKGAPLLIILGLSGLYYLLRKTARKLFAPPSRQNAEDTKHKSSIARKTLYAVLLLLAFFVVYTIHDLRQAKNMAVDTCNRAVKGMPLEDFLSKFPEKDYKIIKRPEYTIIVPKSGMGRNSCNVSHDGQKITGSKTGFND